MRTPTRLIAAFIGALILSTSHNSRADDSGDSPTDKGTHLELGLGIAGAHFPDYPGASRYWNILLPIPYVTLHSRYLDANRDRVRSRVLRGQKWSLDIDFSGSVPVSSSRDPERHDMPNLGWLAQVGPIAKYRVWRDDASGNRLDLVLPVRVAASVNALTFHHRGWVMQPAIKWTRLWGAGERFYHADVTLSRAYATGDYFNYIYGVAPQYADTDRPAYRAGNGTGAYRLELGFGWRQGDMRWGGFVQYTDLSGASFRDSPLVSQRHQVSFGFAVAWVFRHIDR
jgi:MipA family protein